MQAIDTDLIVHEHTGPTSGNEHTITNLTLRIASPLNQLFSLLSVTWSVGLSPRTILVDCFFPCLTAINWISVRFCFALSGCAVPNVSSSSARKIIEPIFCSPFVFGNWFPNRLLIQIEIERLGEIVATLFFNLGINATHIITLLMLHLLLSLDVFFLFPEEVTVSCLGLLIKLETIWELRMVVRFCFYRAIFGSLVSADHHSELTCRGVPISEMVQIVVLFVGNAGSFTVFWMEIILFMVVLPSANSALFITVKTQSSRRCREFAILWRFRISLRLTCASWPTTCSRASAWAVFWFYLG